MDSFSQQMLDNALKDNKSMEFKNSLDNDFSGNIQFIDNKTMDMLKNASNIQVQLERSEKIIDSDGNILSEYNNSVFEQKSELTVTRTSDSSRYFNNKNAMSDWVNEILSNSSLSKNTPIGSVENLKTPEYDKTCDDNDKPQNGEPAPEQNGDCVIDKPKILPKPTLPPKPLNYSTLTKKNSFERENIPLLPKRKPTDPAEMTLKDRLALFERNKGAALVPKAALGMSIATKHILPDKKNDKPYAQISNSNGTHSAGELSTQAHANNIRQTMAALFSNNGTTMSESEINSENRKKREEEMNLLTNRYNKVKNIDEYERIIRPTAPPTGPPPPPPAKKSSKNSISPNSAVQNGLHAEIESALNNSNKRKSGENGGTQIRSAEDDAKRAKISQILNSNLYPSINAIRPADSSTNANPNAEASEVNVNQPRSTDRPQTNGTQISNRNQNDDDDSPTDNRDVREQMNSDESLNNENVFAPRKIEFFDSSLNSSVCDASLNDYLEEALDNTDSSENIGEIDNEDNFNTDGTDSDDGHHNDDEDDGDDTFDCNDIISPMNKSRDSTVSSDSFCFQKRPKNYPENAKIIEEMEDDDCPMDKRAPLMHSVSVYRRQQAQTLTRRPQSEIIYSTKPREISTAANKENISESDVDISRKVSTELVDKKIKTLMDNVSVQQHHITQATNALNTCAATFEFSGSMESVIAEWKLLVATNTLKAALNEISRLRVERCLRNPSAPKECGRLTINSITIPLRQDYISKLASDAICGHHLVCLLKLNDDEQVIATKTIPTLPGLLAVKFPDSLQLQNVYVDFKATLEIYGIAAQREILPHNIKYHIKNKNGISKTPKGKKKNDANILIMPVTQSPMGQNTMPRSTNFIHFGFVSFTLRDINQNCWQLNQVSGASPLTGSIFMKANCELAVKVDYKGFLNMFEDVSGFGAWHRRWCHLHGNILNYWMYPDDEQKTPIGSIDLLASKQTKVCVAPRDICARLNTIMVELRNPNSEHVSESLTVLRDGNDLVKRHLLSADTKNERDEWCLNVNRALNLSKAWGPMPMNS